MSFIFFACLLVVDIVDVDVEMLFQHIAFRNDDESRAGNKAKILLIIYILHSFKYFFFLK